jgi:hypothetical protein
LPIDSLTAFVSYSRVDSDFALRLVEDLRGAGANVWLDQIELEPGRPWDIEIERALSACTRMLVILSPTSVNSTNVLDEVSYALKKQKIVIPVLYQDCDIPLRLNRLQYVDVLTNYSRGLKALLRSLAVPTHAHPNSPAQLASVADHQTPIAPTSFTAAPVTPPPVIPTNTAPPPAASDVTDPPQVQRQILHDLDAILNAGRQSNQPPAPAPQEPKPDTAMLDELSRLISRSGQ